MKKKVFNTVLMTLVSVIAALSVLMAVPTKAEAATKKKSTKTVSAEEQQVIDLTAYLNALKKQGGSEADIEYAEAALALATKALEEKQAADAQAAAQAAAQQAIIDQLAKTATQPAVVYPIIYVGDSRMVQMHETMGNTGVVYIAENSKGYTWFRDEAIPYIDSYAGKGSKIVINLGVNDPGNADNYVALVNAKALEWRAKGATVYYATVNPVSDNPYTSPEQVDMINDKLKAGLQGVNIIDTYSYLKSTGYTLVDGLHYDSATYINLYNYILNSIVK